MNAQEQLDLDERYLRMANDEQRYSQDPSTQIGVCLVTPSGKIILAANQFPAGVKPRLERPEKYDYIEHAERMAIYCAARQGIETEGSTLYMIGMGPPSGPCSPCARAIIAAGIIRVVVAPYKPLSTGWGIDVYRGTEMLSEAGVEYVEFDFQALGVPEVKPSAIDAGLRGLPPEVVEEPKDLVHMNAVVPMDCDKNARRPYGTGQCQVCGRLNDLTGEGLVPFHTQGEHNVPCPGAGEEPRKSFVRKPV